jgi:hypothetical protein
MQHDLRRKKSIKIIGTTRERLASILRKIIGASWLRHIRTFLPMRPILALPSFGRMHRLAAKLLHEPLRMRLSGKAEYLIPFLLPDNGMAVFRKREAVCPAKLAVLLKVRACALLLDQSDPVREASLCRPLYARLPMRHWPTCLSRSAASSSTLASIRPNSSSAEPVHIPARWRA